MTTQRETDPDDEPAPPPLRAGRRQRRITEHDEPDSAWNRAAAATEQLDPFCCRTEWQLSFHEAMRPERSLCVHVDGDSLLAFARYDNPTVGPLLEPVEASWLFGSPLLGPHAAELLEHFLAGLAARGDRPAVLLSGLTRRGPLLHRLVRRFAPRYELFQLQPTTLCSASLDGGLDGYLSRRSGSWRRNLRQAARRARDAGVTFERQTPRTAAAADAVYRRILAVEQQSWKGLDRCGMTESPSREFYDVMLQRLAASGRGRVVFARHDERDIGFIFGSLTTDAPGAVYRGQQFSYAEDWRPASIGNLLAIEQLRWLGEQGARRYDMGPLMDYKTHWTEHRAQVETLLMLPS